MSVPMPSKSSFLLLALSFGILLLYASCDDTRMPDMGENPAMSPTARGSVAQIKTVLSNQFPEDRYILLATVWSLISSLKSYRIPGAISSVRFHEPRVLLAELCRDYSGHNRTPR